MDLGQKGAQPRGIVLYIGLYRDTIKKFTSEISRSKALIFDIYSCSICQWTSTKLLKVWHWDQKAPLQQPLHWRISVPLHAKSLDI